MIRRLSWLLWPAAVVIGLAAERATFGWNDPRSWVPDLTVGWVLIACGLIAAARRPESLIGPLLAAAGFTWFANNFSSASVGPVAWLAAQSAYLHRGPLVHALLTYPTGRTSSWTIRAAIGIGYAVALMYPVWGTRIGTILMSIFLIAVSGAQYFRTVGRSRRARAIALLATSIFGLVLGGYAVARLAEPVTAVSGFSILAYQMTLCAIGGGLLVGLLTAPWERSAVTDLVVELGEARSDSLRDSLARALGDSTLQVGYWLPDGASFVDPAGRPFALPAPDSERAVTMVERDGEPVAALVHDPAVLDDPGLLEAVSSATQLAASNARLQAEVQARVDDLRASRRRLLEAGDEERRRLERRLHEGAEQRLTRLSATVSGARARANGITTATAEKIGRAQDQLVGTLADLRELARGLHPRALAEQGLERALASLAERSVVPVELAVSAVDPSPEVEAAVYFLCSEGLANIGKYASATRAEISVKVIERDLLTVRISDNGVGGADLSGGTGMVGLADRIEALGGTFHVESPSGKGTSLSAEIPLTDRSA